MAVRSVDTSGGANPGSGRSADYVAGCGEPFYGTRVGPGWYQSSARVARGCKAPFSVLPMLILRRPKATQSHIKATYEPSTWEGVGTYKPPSCDPHATLMRPSCDPHATFMRPSCDLHATLMRPSCDLHATFMRPSCDLSLDIADTLGNGCGSTERVYDYAPQPKEIRCRAEPENMIW
jgi:hypothetical protein